MSELSVDLDHKRRRSIISVAARIESERGPWSLSLLTEDSDRTETLTLKASVRDLVPAVWAEPFPSLALLRSLEIPTAADAAIRFKTSGELNGADIAVEVSRGLIDFGPAMAAPLLIDAGLFNFNYDAEADVYMAPSTVRSAKAPSPSRRRSARGRGG